MRTSTEATQNSSSIPRSRPPEGVVLQRKCACGGSATMDSECRDCNAKRLSLQRYSTARVAPHSLVAPAVLAPGSTSQDQQDDASRRLGHNFGQVALHAGATRRIQTKSHAIQSGDRYEEEADSIARQVTRTLHDAGDGAETPMHSSEVSPSIQRSADDRDESDAKAAPSAAGAQAVTAPAASTSPQAGARTLIVEDDARELGPGQMRKSEFLDQMEREVCSAADDELAAVGHTSQGCPYVRNWLAFYRNRGSQHIERALRHYAPEAAGAASARDYIPFVTARVRRSAAIWATTGRVTGVPAELAAQLPGAGLLGAVGGILAGAAGMLTGMFAGIGRTLGGIFTKAREGGAADAADPAEIQSQLGSGQSLGSGVRSRMEPAFGHDFSRVRIHADSRAAVLSSQLNARAFTIGSDIAFAAGDYQPGTPAGDALLAHELAHVVQQRGANAHSAATAATPTDTLEREADASAQEVVLSQWELSGQEGAASEPVLSKKTPEGNHRHKPGPRAGLRLQRCSKETPPPTTATGKTAPVETPKADAGKTDAGKTDATDVKTEPKPEAPKLDAMDNAAIGGLTSIFCKTKKTGHEWCGNIFRNSKGQYRLSGPFEGGKSLCGKEAPVQSDERMVGYYHSHPPGESLDFSNEGSSFGLGQGSQTGPKDIQEADSHKITYYLINSEGEMKRYDPPTEVGIGGGHTTELGKIDTKC